MCWSDQSSGNNRSSLERTPRCHELSCPQSSLSATSSSIDRIRFGCCRSESIPQAVTIGASVTSIESVASRNDLKSVIAPHILTRFKPQIRNDTCCGKIHKTRCRVALFWIIFIPILLPCIGYAAVLFIAFLMDLLSF